MGSSQNIYVTPSKHHDESEAGSSSIQDRTSTKFNNDDTLPIFYSPYFTRSQSRKRKRDPSPSVRPSQTLRPKEKARRQTKKISQKASEAIQTVPMSDEVEDLWWEKACVTVKDPLSCYHFRTQGRLYHRLWLVKPTLIQERVAEDPWKVMIATTLLNQTGWRQAVPIFWKIVERWPSPENLSKANEEDLVDIIQPLGLQRIRAHRLILMSKMYFEDPPDPTLLRQSRAYVNNSSPGGTSVLSSDSAPTGVDSPSPRKKSRSPRSSGRQRYPPTPISHLPGAGPYALDSYRIYCTPPADKEWKIVMPSDKELIGYLRWRWAFEERKVWVPGIGVVKDVDASYLEELADDLEK